MIDRLRIPPLIALCVIAPWTLACGGDIPDAGDADADAPSQTATPEAEPAEPPMRVFITAPADGAELETGTVLVTLGVQGLTIVPAGDQTPRSGHHHLIVNADLPTMEAPIPAVEGQYIHMGAGQTELELTDLEPGDYSVIALVGDFAHVPLDPPVADTIHFVVRE